MFTYRGRKTQQISFPLGGIGTGCVGLAGNGRLVDWEIFGRPNKGSVNGFSHFAIKAEDRGRLVDARVLNADLPPHYQGGGIGMSGFGFGPARETLAGLPHFQTATFKAAYPLARLEFASGSFPGRVDLQAFNPFIPLNDHDSGIPAAFFEVTVRNTSRRTLTYTLAGVLGDPLVAPNRHATLREPGMTALHYTTTGAATDAIEYGDLTIATDAPDAGTQEYWFRGAWFDSLEVYWRDFTASKPMPARQYPSEQAGNQNQGTLTAGLRLKPGETGRVRFVITWNFPNMENYWSKQASESAVKAGIPPRWKHYYATQWPDAMASARYALTQWDRLFNESERFRNGVMRSSLPKAALDAITANLSILKSATVLRMQDGTFYGWEGCCGGGGCCEGSCTHVWNYAMALPFLFPKLERSMREADYRYNQQDNGGMPFRIQLPLGLRHPGGRSCADGLFGGVMKTYRDWKVSGDDAWLRSIWPAVRRSIEFAWDPTNEDRWDPDQRGVLTGRQHHTLDMELFGPNSWLTGFYLGALKAAAEMAEHLGESGEALRYRDLFTRGKTWTDKHLFNGSYYCQEIDLADASIPDAFKAGETYWDAEHGEIKYQIGQGCAIDQVLAQWHANLYGLGDLFDPKQLRRALQSLYVNNFVRRARDVYNPCRLYCLNDESGMAICTWPESVGKPMIPLTYAQETMHGFEYSAGILMIQSGMIREGMNIVKAVRDRYDGERRNPWNEFECGSNYARSMAAYALLNAFSGFEFDRGRGLIGFNPVTAPGKPFRCFWSLDGAWGMVSITARRMTVEVLYGSVPVSEVKVPASWRGNLAVSCDGAPVAVAGREKQVVRFEKACEVPAGQRLTLQRGR